MNKKISQSWEKDSRRKVKTRWYPSSTKIKKTIFDKTTGIYYVVFTNNDVYKYLNVPVDIVNKLHNHKFVGNKYNYSIGTAFTELIQKNKDIKYKKVL